MEKNNFIKNYPLTLTAKSRNVIKKVVLMAEEEANAIIGRANEYASAKQKEMQELAQELYLESYNAAKNDAAAEVATLLLNVHEMRQKSLYEIEKKLLSLSVDIAEKIIGKEIETNPNTLFHIVAQAIQQMRQCETITIKVNPQNTNTLRQQLKTFKELSGCSYISIAGDTKIIDDGCIMESNLESIDARLETQMEVVKRALIEAATLGENKTGV